MFDAIISILGNTLYFSIAEEDYATSTVVTPSNPPLGLAAVQDLDSTSFKFTIIGGENSDHFTVDENNGDILTAMNEIDAEKIPQYNLTVRVQDYGSPILFVDVFCIIEVTDKNEFNPVCGSNSYVEAVSEDSVNQEVITVTASDPDKGQSVNFAISKQVYIGNDDVEIGINAFAVDTNSGVISVLGKLDHEIGTQVSLFQLL